MGWHLKYRSLVNHEFVCKQKGWEKFANCTTFQDFFIRLTPSKTLFFCKIICLRKFHYFLVKRVSTAIRSSLFFRFYFTAKTRSYSFKMDNSTSVWRDWLTSLLSQSLSELTLGVRKSSSVYNNLIMPIILLRCSATESYPCNESMWTCLIPSSCKTALAFRPWNI